MAEPIPPDARRAQTQLKFAVLFLIAINAAILVKVFLPTASSSKTVGTNSSHKAVPPSDIVETPEPTAPPVPAVNSEPATLGGAPALVGKRESSPVVLPAATSPAGIPGTTTGQRSTTAGFSGHSSSIASTGGFSISGTVRLNGTPPPEREITPIKADAKCGGRHSGPVFTRGYLVSAERGLANVVVSIESGLDSGSFPVPTSKALVDQIGCMYEPYVTAVMARQEVVFRNSDPFMHNVNALAKVNSGFNFAQSTEGQETSKSFTKPEMVKVVCNVHPWMAGYVSVFEHPFFAVTDTNGNFQIPAGLATGEYSLRLSHLRVGVSSLPVRIEPGLAAKVDCSFSIE